MAEYWKSPVCSPGGITACVLEEGAKVHAQTGAAIRSNRAHVGPAQHRCQLCSSPGVEKVKTAVMGSCKSSLNGKEMGSFLVPGSQHVGLGATCTCLLQHDELMLVPQMGSPAPALPFLPLLALGRVLAPLWAFITSLVTRSLGLEPKLEPRA